MQYEECCKDMIVMTPRKWHADDEHPTIMAVVIRKNDLSKKVLVQWGNSESRQTDWYDPEELILVPELKQSVSVIQSDIKMWAALNPEGKIIGVSTSKRETDRQAVFYYLEQSGIGYDSYYGYSEIDETIARHLGYRSFYFVLPRGLTLKQE